MNMTDGEYTGTAKWLHWVMAALIVPAWLIGFYVSDLPKGPEKAAIMAWHKGFGTAVLALITVRLAWRLLNPPPRLPDTMSPGLQQAAHSAHWTLYGLMIAQPMSGWVISSGYGYPVKLFGLITLPALVEKNEALAGKPSWRSIDSWVGLWRPWWWAMSSWRSSITISTATAF